MYYLDTLTLKNVRSFRNKETTIKFARGLTVIIGHNGSGKSTLLEALSYLIAKDKLDYSSFEANTALENDTMIMRCNLTRGAQSGDATFEFKSINTSEFDTPNTKEAKQSPETSNNDLVFEITHKINRTRRSTAMRYKSGNSDEVARLQNFQGLFKYCLACSVSNSAWMFGSAEALNKDIDKILNISRFTDLAKAFGPSLKALTASEVNYKQSRKHLLTQQRSLADLLAELQTKNTERLRLQHEYESIIKYEDNFKTITDIHADISKQLQPYVITAEVGAARGRGPARGATNQSCIVANLAVFLFDRDDNSIYGSNHILEYLDMCSKNSSLSELYRSICQQDHAQQTSLTEPYPLVSISHRICRELEDLKVQMGILQRNLIEAQSNYNPDAVSLFIDKYGSQIQSIFGLRGELDKISAFTLTFGNPNLSRKQDFMKSFSDLINALPDAPLSASVSNNASTLSEIFFSLASVFLQITTLDLALEETIMSLNKDLEETRKTLATERQKLASTMTTFDSLSCLSEIANEITSNVQASQNLAAEELTKRSSYDQLFTSYTILQTELRQAQSRHSAATALYKNHCIPYQRLVELKTTLLESRVLLCVPTLLSLIRNRNSSPLHNNWSSCLTFLAGLKDKWHDLVDSLKPLNYPTLSQLTGTEDAELVFSSAQLNKLEAILGFLVEKICSCIELDSSWHASLTSDVAFFFTDMNAKLSTALQQWTSATDTLMRLAPTLRSDFSLYLSRTTNSSVPAEEVMKIFNDFLRGYEHEAAKEKESIVHHICTALAALSDILPAAIILREMDMPMNVLLIELSNLQDISQELKKVTFDEHEASISANGIKSQSLLDGLIKQLSVIFNMYDLNLFDTSFEIMYETIDQDEFKHKLEAFLGNLVNAAKQLEDTSTESENMITTLTHKLNEQQGALSLAKTKLDEVEQKKHGLQMKISKLEKQFLSKSIDNEQYSLEYAQQLNTRCITLNENISQLNQTIDLANRQCEALEKKLNHLSSDNKRISLPVSVSITYDSLTAIGTDLKAIQNAPSMSDIKTLQQRHEAVQSKVLVMTELNELLARYISIEKEVRKLGLCLENINFSCPNSGPESSFCHKMHSAVAQLRGRLHGSDYKLKDLDDCLRNILLEYNETHANVTKEMHHREGEYTAHMSNFEKFKHAFSEIVENYAKAKATFLINDASNMLSDYMGRKVKEFKRSLLRKINVKLHSLWKQCYARVDRTGVEIHTIRLEVRDVDKGENSKEILELQAISTDPHSGKDVTRSFRDSCSTGQRNLASILLRLAFAYVSASPYSFIVLDEPTVHLDAQNTERLANALVELIQSESSTQMVVITHNTEFHDILTSSTDAANVLAYKLSYEENGSVINEVELGET